MVCKQRASTRRHTVCTTLVYTMCQSCICTLFIRTASMELTHYTWYDIFPCRRIQCSPLLMLWLKIKLQHTRQTAHCTRGYVFVDTHTHTHTTNASFSIQSESHSKCITTKEDATHARWHKTLAAFYEKGSASASPLFTRVALQLARSRAQVWWMGVCMCVYQET